MNKKLLLPVLAGCLWGASSAEAKIRHLLPRPQQVEQTAGAAFGLGRPVRLELPAEWAELTAPARFLAETGCTRDDAAGAVLRVRRVEQVAGAFNHPLADFPDEAYRLTVTADEVTVEAVTETGVVRAMQTLAQLAEGYEGTPALEALAMTDWPAFKLRGMMHDVGRSFVSFDELKKEIDLLSRFKVNVFHWHLTENQAWRFEVKAYPALTSAASMTRFAGNYYTQEQCRELEEYAAQRGITVIPEIDMPGHSAAFERAMGHTMQTDQGVEELQQILTEVAAVFVRAPYIHIGADEQTITYPNFLKIMTDKVHSLGKKVVVWNPIRGVSISKDAGFDMTQMWSTSGRVVQGMPNIDCRYNYTNHFDVFADLVGIYKSNIYYSPQGTTDIAGFISAPWNDRKTPTQEDIVRQNNIYANVLASAERAWIGGGRRYIEEGGTTLPNSGEEYEEFRDWETRFLFHKDHSLAAEPIPYVRQTNVRWRISDAFPNGGNSAAQFPPETAADDVLPDVFDYEGTTYGSGMATGAAVYLRHTWGEGTIPGFYARPQLNTTAYAWTYVYSPVEQTVGAQIEFQNYGRSENDKAPDAGKWDRKGSRVWLNGTEIMPPVWENSGRAINAEVDLKNENFTARRPVAVTLKAGWNKVLLKLPYVSADGVRLNKWLFTFVLTDTEGRNAVDGLIYSPGKCMDEAAEQVAATVSEIKKFRRSVIGTAPGYYPESCAAELDAVLAEVEPTLTQQLTVEQRAAQMARLNEAFEAFRSSYSTASPVLPQASTQEQSHWYRLSTPLREGRFVTAGSTGANITGEATATERSAWKFVTRTDGTFDIVNYGDGSFVSPASANNTALKTTASSPSAGWTLKAADEPGFLIVTSGTVQMNQTTLSGKPLYNWGGGSNTSDTGCKFRIEEAEGLSDISEETFAARLDEARTLLAQTGIGFPAATAAERTALAAAVSDAEGSQTHTAAQWATLNTAVTDYRNTPEERLAMPVDGGAYTITNVQQNGTTYAYYMDGENGLVHAEAGVPAAQLGCKAVFVCRRDGDKYNFVNGETGKFLVWKGKSEGANADKGYVDDFEAGVCGFSLHSGNASTFGTLYLEGKRGNGKDGVLILLANGTFDAWSNGPGYAGNYSNLNRIEEAAYPNTVRLAAPEGHADRHGYAGIYLPFAAVLPEGVTAWTGRMDNGTVKMTAVEGAVLPAATAAVLRADAGGEALLVPSVQTAAAPEGNELLGTMAAGTAVPAGAYVADGARQTGFGFYPCTTATLPVGVSYIVAPGEAACYFADFGDGPTGIRQLRDAPDGAAPLYDLGGRRVQSPAKGVYIRGGQKILVP